MLAMELGKTVGQLKIELTVNELKQWLAYSQINPFGNFRSDINTASICTVIAQVNGNKSAKLADFIPDFNKSESIPIQVDAEILHKRCKEWAAFSGNKI